MGVGNTIVEAQKRDKSLEYFFKLAEKEDSPFFLQKGVLMRNKSKNSSDARLVLPTESRSEAMDMFHDSKISGAHMSYHKTMDRLTERFWWPNMRKEVDFWIKSCMQCATHKPSKPSKLGRLMSIPVSEPFEIVGIDVVGPLTVSEHGNRWIVVITDHFTKWAEAFATSHHDAETVANLLVEQVILYREKVSEHLTNSIFFNCLNFLRTHNKFL